MRSLAVLAVFLSLVITTIPAQSAVFYVRTDGSDANPGTSWALAKQTVQAGLNAASAGDEVWVAKGTYGAHVTLKSGVALYGGFTGAETLLAQRNVYLNKTVIDGNYGLRVITAPQGATETTRLDGFTVRNGSQEGIYCYYSSPVIANNHVTGTTAGAGIRCIDSSPVIVSNIIAGNCANGGISCSGSPTIVSNTIVGNTAEEGGGIRCHAGSPYISNNIVAFNSSGIRKHSPEGLPMLRNNCVYGNTDYDYSGISEGTDDISADPLLANKDYGNMHIQPGSPCINSGWNDAPELAASDIDEQPRIQGGVVDIGADESDGTVWPTGPSIILRISPLGDDASEGSSWEQAKRTVQAGVNAASALGGEVWVMEGIYTERIRLGPFAHLYGGFAGTESSRADRNWQENQSVLDGGGAGSVVTVMSGHLLSSIDGFTIRNGTGTQAYAYLLGGGIYCSYSSPIIANNTITGNSAAQGGGIGCFYSAPHIRNNTIRENAASSGGAIYGNWGSPHISKNVISDNMASSSGGGISFSTASPSAIVITDNVIVANESLSSAGGVGCFATKFLISRNIIDGNTAGSNGGGLFCSGTSSSLVRNNTISRNRTSSSGGGLAVSGTARITNNIIVENTAANVGGIYYNYYSAPAVANNIIAFNSSGIYKGDYQTSTLIIRNNCVFGNTSYDYSGLDAGTGDISADPLFVDRPAGNYHLSIASPCINAGWNDAAGLPETDMDGEPRICAGIVDIGADECWLKAASVRDAKATANGMMAEMSGSIVSAAFPNHFYIEAEDRSSGIRVEKAGHELEEGMTSFVSGTIGTNEDGEKFIAADTAVSDGEGSVKPLFLNNKTLGGGNSIGFGLATGLGQRGVGGGLGLNNIGLLITTIGWLTYSGPDYFYIDDGSALDDGSGHLGVKVLGPGPDPGENGKYIRVTGVSSIRESGGNHIRAIESCVEDGVQVLK